jgi:hypothetical protein
MALSNTYPTLEQLLEEARRRIQVAPEELDEAKRRRSAVRAALLKEFPGSRIYYNGSVAHGDALTPLTDVDLGVVVPDLDDEYGPGKRGPRSLQDRAANAVKRELKAEFGDLRVEVEGRKRSILVRFNDPVRDGWDDFTADIIVALDNPYGAGLYIPRYDTWDRSHPEKHTALVRDAIESSKVRFARAVRLLKHWNRNWSEPAVCTWHIKVLALGCLTEPGRILPGLIGWFEYAAKQINAGPTPDPANVGPDLKPAIAKVDAVRRLRVAADKLAEAQALEQGGWPVLAHAKLAEVFNDPEMLPAPSDESVRLQEAERLRRRTQRSYTGPAFVGAVPPVRSWSWKW